MNKPKPKSTEDIANLGCLALVGLLVLPMILASLLKAILPFVFLGGLGVGIYRLYLYDGRTGNITQVLEQFLNISQSKKTIHLEELDYKIKALHAENETLRLEHKREIKEAIEIHSKSIGKKKKKEVLDTIFGNQVSDTYTRSDEFERQEIERHRKKKKDELDTREFQLEVKGELFQQDRKIFEVDKRVTDVAHEAKEDRFKIREEVREGWKNVDAKFEKVDGKFEKVDARFSYMDTRFVNLERDFSSFKSYVAEKFGRIETDFARELYSVKDLIGKLRVYTKEEFSKVKLQFGSEVLRMDKQQLKIIKHLDKYQTKVKEYSNEITKVKTAAMAHSIRSEDMLNKVHVIHQKHKTIMSKYSDKMELGLSKMAMRDERFANTVGAAKLRLDEMSKDMHFSLKDMAYERIGIESLRSDYDQRVQLENEKMNNLLEKKKHLEEKINMAREKKENSGQLSQLKHQLHLTKENLSYTNHRASLLQQENGMIRRFTR